MNEGIAKKQYVFYMFFVDRTPTTAKNRYKKLQSLTFLTMQARRHRK